MIAHENVVPLFVQRDNLIRSRKIWQGNTILGTLFVETRTIDKKSEVGKVRYEPEYCNKSVPNG